MQLSALQHFPSKIPVFAVKQKIEKIRQLFEKIKFNLTLIPDTNYANLLYKLETTPKKLILLIFNFEPKLQNQKR